MSPALGREATITTAHVITGPRSSRRMSALLGLRLSQPARAQADDVSATMRWRVRWPMRLMAGLLWT